VVSKAKVSGIRIDKISRSRKWFTIIMRPDPEEPAGRSSAQEGNEESVTS
jgi:hypothetical protein